MTNEILEEVRAARLAYAERFNFDVYAIGRDLRERSRLSGRKVVSLPPKRIVPPPEDVIAAGADPLPASECIDPRPEPASPPESAALPG